MRVKIYHQARHCDAATSIKYAKPTLRETAGGAMRLNRPDSMRMSWGPVVGLPVPSMTLTLLINIGAETGEV
jgi:hypothetical protein